MQISSMPVLANRSTLPKQVSFSGDAPRPVTPSDKQIQDAFDQAYIRVTNNPDANGNRHDNAISEKANEYLEVLKRKPVFTAEKALGYMVEQARKNAHK